MKLINLEAFRHLAMDRNLKGKLYDFGEDRNIYCVDWEYAINLEELVKVYF